MRKGLIGGVLALALLAGCSRSGETTEEAPAENVTTPVAPVEAPPPVVEEPAPLPPPEPDRNVAEALPPEVPTTVDAQMLEDADATGLTARTATPDVVSEPPADPLGAANGGLDSGPK